MKNIGIVMTLVLSSAITTMALFGAFYLGIMFGEGTPASHPPRGGEERLSFTINTRDGAAVEVTIHEIRPGKIYISSSPGK
jgi:hypothetical protein